MADDNSKIDPLKAILEEGAKLPSLPQVVIKLDQELGKDEVDLAHVGKLISMDPVLSGQILRLANSSWYSRGGAPIQDFARALIRLGIPTTRQLVHALVMPSLFPKKGGAIDMAAFWRHSFAVALFAQAIGRRMKLNREQMELLWTAGLLHDIGALLFDQVAGETYRRLMRICQQTPSDDGMEAQPIKLRELEREWMGVDHANMGATFLQKRWQLPDKLVWCVRFHEELDWAMEEPEAIPSILPLHLAVVLCEQNGVSWVGQRAHHQGEIESVWRKIGFPEGMGEELAQDVAKSLEQAEQMLHSK